MAFDLLVDRDTNDIIYENGAVKLTTTKPQLLRQKLNDVFKTWTGEWFNNTGYGAIDRSVLFQQGVTRQEIDAFFQSIVLGFSEVNSIDSWESDLNPITREYDLKYVVITDYGDVSGFVTSRSPDLEIDYTQVMPPVAGLTCDSFLDENSVLQAGGTIFNEDIITVQNINIAASVASLSVSTSQATVDLTASSGPFLAVIENSVAGTLATTGSPSVSLTETSANRGVLLFLMTRPTSALPVTPVVTLNGQAGTIVATAENSNVGNMAFDLIYWNATDHPGAGSYTLSIGYGGATVSGTVYNLIELSNLSQSSGTVISSNDLTLVDDAANNLILDTDLTGETGKLAMGVYSGTHPDSSNSGIALNSFTYSFTSYLNISANNQSFLGVFRDDVIAGSPEAHNITVSGLGGGNPTDAMDTIVHGAIAINGEQ